MLAVGLLNGGATVVIDDPWNATPGGPGRQFQMTADGFAAAWGNTRFSGGTDHSNAGWNYIGFHSTSTTGVTPEITPTPTDTPEPAALPSPPTNVAAQITCQYTTMDCPAGWIPVKVTWSAPAGLVTGYRVYYTPGSLDLCPNIVWTATGAPQLVATVAADAHSWSGQLAETNEGGKYSVVAYNDAGPSRAAMTNWVDRLDVVICQ